MKSEIQEKEKLELKFPCLMKSVETGVIVVFTEVIGGNGTGFVVNAGKSVHPIFHKSDQWTMRNFEPFNGTVTISND